MRGTDALRRSDAVARSYRAALARLVRGEGRHADHAGRVVRISPASVAREAGRSRNPLYTTHRDILDEIEAAAGGPAGAAAGGLLLRVGGPHGGHPIGDDELRHQHLRQGGDRQGEQRPDGAGERPADQQGHDRGGRRDVDGVTHHPRDDHEVLHLLVGQQERPGHHDEKAADKRPAEIVIQKGFDQRARDCGQAGARAGLMGGDAVGQNQYER